MNYWLNNSKNYDIISLLYFDRNNLPTTEDDDKEIFVDDKEKYMTFIPDILL